MKTKRTEYAPEATLPELFAKRVDYDRDLYEAATLLWFNNKADPFAANMSGCSKFFFAAMMLLSERLRKINGREPSSPRWINYHRTVLHTNFMQIADCTGVIQTVYDHAIKAAYAFKE